MKVKCTFMGVLMLVGICFQSKAQHNFDNQSVIYSRNGRLGIKTSNPREVLDVRGTVAMGASNNNRWAFVTPNDSRRKLFLAPWSTSSNFWNWGVNFEFHQDGRMKLNGSSPGIWIAASSGDWFMGRSGSNFRVYFGGADRMMFLPNGNVGIGTSNPKDKLAVNGTIRAKEVRVMTNIDIADYVFADDYALRSLAEVDQYVQQHRHLPGVPSAQEVKEEGLKVAEFQNKLLEKIEELTLYVIAQEKRIEAVESELEGYKILKK